MKVSPLLLSALVLFGAACSSDPDREKPKSPFIKDVIPMEEKRNKEKDKNLSAEVMYKHGRSALDVADFSTAIEQYDKLTTIHPFSDYATQGELERIYAEYRSYDADKALTNADKFLREHPRHPAVDYVQYLKGLINFGRDEESVSFLPIDPTKSEVTNQRRAFDDFALLLQKYPSSKYAGDAYQRMVYVRSRLAEHELHVVDFYVRRGAYVAAAKRSEQIIALYPGTKASYAALESLAICYDKANLKMQADDARHLIAAQTHLKDLPAAPGEPGILDRITGIFGKSDTEAVRPSSEAPPPPAAPPDSATAKAGDDSANGLHFYSEPKDDGTPASTAPAGDAGTEQKEVPTPPPAPPSTPATTAAPVLTAPLGKSSP